MSELIPLDGAQLIRAEIDMQITTAKAYPRNSQGFIAEATAMATIDQKTAESCFYCLFRKDKQGKQSEIKGPSIRLAEIAASCWGNFQAAARIVGNDGKQITAEGVAWDLEKNVKVSMQIKRSIMTKGKDGKPGYTYGEDMQTVTSNAACALALRNAILKVIPKAFIDRVYEAAMSFSVGDQKTLATQSANVLNRLSLMGIPQEKVLGFFNKQSSNEITADELRSLIGIGTALKEGMISIDAAFSLDDETGAMSVGDRIKFLINQKNNTSNEEKEDEKTA